MKTYEQKLAHAHAVMERYFDTDIQDADSAMDVFLDNHVDPEIAASIAHDMFPPTAKKATTKYHQENAKLAAAKDAKEGPQ